MWSQNKLNVSQSAFLFSIIAHVAILIVLLKPDAENSSDITSTMKVTFVSASIKTNNDTVRISSEPSHQRSINFRLRIQKIGCLLD